MEGIEIATPVPTSVVDGRRIDDPMAWKGSATARTRSMESIGFFAV